MQEVTPAEALRAAGYTTAHIGKWHLGADPWYPETQGFDVNIGGTDYGQPPSYFDPYYSERQGTIPTLEPRHEGEYLTDREADEAVRFIRRHSEDPFFLHFAPYAVHTPIQAKDSLVARYMGKPKTHHADPVYAAMVHSVDVAVGRILDALEEAGVADRTFIIRWPGVVPPATVSYEPVQAIDVLPTILEAAGVPLPQGRTIDGVSLVPHLRSGGQVAIGRERLFWHVPHYRQGHRIPPYSIMRQGPWKLIQWHAEPRYELYHLQNDPGEITDLAEVLPERVANMDVALSAWFERTDASWT